MTEKPVRESVGLAFLVPEFPGQTHGFFWREFNVLKELGVVPELVSTRPPRRNAGNPDWGGTAIGLTTYLGELSWPAAAAVMRALRMPGTPGLLATIRRANGIPPRGGRRLLRPGNAGFLAAQLVWLALGARLAAMAKDRGWQHVHVHSCGNAATIALYARLLSGLPYSLTLHGPLSDYGPNQATKWANAAFAIVITPELAGEVQRTLGPAVPGRVAVAPMGVDAREFRRTEPYLPWDGRESFRVFCCGRLNPSKGHDVLLAAVARMRREGADVDLVIAGEDESGGSGYHRELDRLISRNGLSGHVVLLGAVPAGRIREELQRAHVFALASHAEPLGVVLLEAMCMGVPVVATAAGGVPGLVVDGTGLLVSPGDPGELAGALTRLMTDPELCRSLGTAGRERAGTSFSYRRSAEVLAQLLREGVAPGEEQAENGSPAGHPSPSGPAARTAS